MESYRIEWKRSAVKDLEKIPREFIPRILEAVETLDKNPFPYSARKIFGTENFFRIRVAVYRIIYHVDKKRKVITNISSRRTITTLTPAIEARTSTQRRNE